MWLFEKNEEKKDEEETLVMKTEQQKDAFIDRLESAHVSFEVREHHGDMYGRNTFYTIRVNTADLKKVS